MFKRVGFFVGGCGFFGLFVLYSYIVHKNVFTHLDFNTTVRLQDHISRRFDGFFSFLSSLGSFEPTILILLGIIAYLTFKKKNWFAFLLIAPFGLFHLVEIFGKIFVNHRPPAHFLLRTQHLLDFPQFYVSEQNSYPSGHAGRASFVTLIIGVLVVRSKKLSLHAKLMIIATLLLYDITMFVSRVYLGEHWTTDVIGGMLLGIAAGSVAAIAL